MLSRKAVRRNVWFATLALSAALATAGAQIAPPPADSQAPPSQPSAKPAPPTHITPAQAKELFASVGQILQFASSDTRLPIKHEVKSRLTTRAQVEKYLLDKMNDDKDAKRMERSAIVLKKFGLIPADFQLQPFLVKLLDEQIAAYYDSKTKTVNLLDWIEPDTQKPVLAHELTHALQDQHVHLDKWENQTSDDISRNYTEDRKHVATDEVDTAREAVLEGQAMAVFVDYSLAPLHRNLRDSPEYADKFADIAGDPTDSPVLSRAPLLLQESLLFPYTDGLRFEATLLADSPTPAGAFAAVLDRPPATSYEIMNPHAYERQVKVPLLNMPDIHPVIDADYSPYDIGVMGALDVRILAETFSGKDMAAALTPAWDGGLYYAAQRKNAPDKDSTASVALLYLSQWKSEEAAQIFAKMYAEELPRQYTRAVPDAAAETSPDEQIYGTNEGPVLIVISGHDVFVSEGFELPTARKLQLLMLGAQQGSGMQVASLPIAPPSWTSGWSPTAPAPDPAPLVPQSGLTGSIVHFMADCGMMRAALPH